MVLERWADPNLLIKTGPKRLTAEVATEVRLLRATRTELAVHATERENSCRQTRTRRDDG